MDNVLVVGDLLVGADELRDAITAACGDDVGEVRTVVFGPDMDLTQQHGTQQAMEHDGPEAVDAPDEVVAAVGDADVLVVHFAPVPSAVLEAGTKLRAVVVARHGYENVNVEAASRAGVAVVNILGRNAAAVADQTIGLILDALRHIRRADHQLRAGGWSAGLPERTGDLTGATVGLIGFGKVGRQVARRLIGFDVRLLVHDPYVERTIVEAAGGRRRPDLHGMLADCDVVCLHARLTDETRRFIGAAEFATMPDHAVFVNNARSAMVDMDALADALASGGIAAAGIDVHDDEPLAEDSPWRRMDNVTVTPHLAGQSAGMRRLTAELVGDAVRELVTSGRARNTVNADALG